MMKVCPEVLERIWENRVGALESRKTRKKNLPVDRIYIIRSVNQLV